MQDATHSVARHLVSEKSLLCSKRRYGLAKWVMPKFRFAKSKILIEPEGAKSIDGEHSFRLGLVEGMKQNPSAMSICICCCCAAFVCSGAGRLPI